MEQIAGTGDLTASTMIKSTKNYSQIELSQILEENGIEITPSSNADYFSINVLTTKEQLPLTLKLLNEIVNNAKFDEFEIEKAKKNILNGIKSARDIPLNKALEEYKTELFAGSVYSHTSKILEKTIPNIKRQNIINFYKTIFYPKNLVISVNGDVEKDYIVNELANIFNHKNNGTDFVYAKHTNNIPAITTPKTITTHIKDLQTSWIILGWQTSGTNEIKEFATLQVIDAFMGTGMSSRLFRNIRENLGLAYQIGTGFSPNVLKGGFTMYIGTNPKNIQLAKTSLLKEIQILKKEFVGDKELQDAKNQLIGKYLLALETNLDKANALALYEATGRGFDFVDNYAKIINSITPSDIMEVANKYFLDNYVESVVDKAK